MQRMRARRVALLGFLVVAFLAACMLLEVPPLAVMRQWSEAAGAWFPTLFWLLYVVITQFPLPRTIMTVSAGILFGTVAGIAIAITATTVSAVISLLLVRFLFRDFVAPRLTHPAVETVNQRLERRGWAAVASLRMVAFIPFSVMNYAAALTRVPALPFAVATFAGSLPGTVITVLFGDTLTGEANPTVVALTAVLTLVGLAGLLIDARVPLDRYTQST